MDTACQGNMDEKDMEDLALGNWEFHGAIGPVCVSNCYNLQDTSSVTLYLPWQVLSTKAHSSLLSKIL